MISKHKALLLILIGMLVWSLTLRNGFVWDDEEQIVNNTAVHSLSSLPAFFTGSTFHAGGAEKLSGVYYKPVMMSTFATLYTLFGERAFFFHLFQILLHITNSVLLYTLIRRLFKQAGGENVAIFISIVFLVHPMQVEAVAYASAMQEVLFFFFGMSGLIFTLDYAQKGNAIFIPFIICAFLLSILSKESGALFIAVGITYIIIFSRRHLPRYVLLVGVVCMIYAVLRWMVAEVGITGVGIAPISRLGFVERMYSWPSIVWFYLKTLIFPLHLATSQHWTVGSMRSVAFMAPLVLTTVTVFVLLLSYRFLQAPYKKLYVFFLAWSLLGFALHMHIVPLDMTVAERWFYFPIVGVLAVGAILLLHIRRRMAQRYASSALRIVFVIIVCLMSVRTVIRIQDWHNGLQLYSHDVALSGSFDLYNNVGVELYRAGLYEEAEPYFRKSTELAPYWWTNWTNLGVIEARQGNWDRAEQYYKKAIAHSDYYLAYENYAGALIQRGKFQEATEFLTKEALPRFPNNYVLREMLQMAREESSD